MKKIFLLLFALFATAYTQEISFSGEAKPASTIIAKGENITSAYLNKQRLLIDEDGIFVFGFDKDAKGIFTLRVNQSNQPEKVFTFVLEQMEYEKQSLTIPSKYVSPPKRYLKQIKSETAKMINARTKMQGVNTAYFKEGFTLPVDSVRITAVFGGQRILNGIKKKEHNGIDFGGKEGTPVYAITDGIVRLAEENFYFNGTFVLLDHGQGLSSVYLHLSKLYVKNNQLVKKGELIGEIGSTGRSTGPHLHLGVQWHNKRIDPAGLLNIKGTSKN
ncbi:MAG: M23 peptidase domain protein [Ignavibacteria bacterium]|nr:MAG: M23 peptidase domain protein [Ignavibacteria bacterium]KAF0160709.1 MAG: M23 peptidase domain protein [Ignavibacteria bacterium]